MDNSSKGGNNVVDELSPVWGYRQIPSLLDSPYLSDINYASNNNTLCAKHARVHRVTCPKGLLSNKSTDSRLPPLKASYVMDENDSVSQVSISNHTHTSQLTSINKLKKWKDNKLLLRYSNQDPYGNPRLAKLHSDQVRPILEQFNKQQHEYNRVGSNLAI